MHAFGTLVKSVDSLEHDPNKLPAKNNSWPTPAPTVGSFPVFDKQYHCMLVAKCYHTHNIILILLYILYYTYYTYIYYLWQIICELCVFKACMEILWRGRQWSVTRWEKINVFCCIKSTFTLTFQLSKLTVSTDDRDPFPVCWACFEKVSRTRQNPSDGATFPGKLNCRREHKCVATKLVQ